MNVGGIETPHGGILVMKRLILVPALVALVGAAMAQSTAAGQTFHTEFKIFQADKLQLTVRLWKDGENIRREYEKRIPVTYITTKDGTIIVVNNADRGMRVNNTAPMLKGKFVEEEAVWPMGDVDAFVKQYKAKSISEVSTAWNGKNVTAIKYTYNLPDTEKTLATLWIDKTTKKPIRVVYGKNQNVGVSPSKLKKGDRVTYQTRIEYSRYNKGEAFAKELFQAPTTVVDAGNGEMFGKLGKGPAEPGGGD